MIMTWSRTDSIIRFIDRSSILKALPVVLVREVPSFLEYAFFIILPSRGAQTSGQAIQQYYNKAMVAEKHK